MAVDGRRMVVNVGLMLCCIGKICLTCFVELD